MGAMGWLRTACTRRLARNGECAGTLTWVLVWMSSGEGAGGGGVAPQPASRLPTQAAASVERRKRDDML